MTPIIYLHTNGKEYYKVPAPEPETCNGCVWDGKTTCPKIESECYTKDEYDDEFLEDQILIPATDEALAEWVLWRMNGVDI